MRQDYTFRQQHQEFNLAKLPPAPLNTVLPPPAHKTEVVEYPKPPFMVKTRSFVGAEQTATDGLRYQDFIKTEIYDLSGVGIKLAKVIASPVDFFNKWLRSELNEYPTAVLTRAITGNIYKTNWEPEISESPSETCGYEVLLVRGTYIYSGFREDNDCRTIRGLFLFPRTRDQIATLHQLCVTSLMDGDQSNVTVQRLKEEAVRLGIPTRVHGFC